MLQYSVTFENASGVKKNTWSDWRLTPASPPILPPPEAETNFVTIPGRKGPIDLSTVLSGTLSYNNLEGDWTFLDLDGMLPRQEMQDALVRFLHGQKMKVTLMDDPHHYHEGYVFVGAPQTGNGPNSYTISYVLSPIRYLQDGTEDGV